MYMIFALLLIICVYLPAIPVKIAWIARFADSLSFGAGFSIFEGRFAMKRARMRCMGEKKHLPWYKTELELQRRAILPAAWHAARYLRKRLHLEKLEAWGRLCLSNAARTAMVYGCLRSLDGALAACTNSNRIHLHPEPDFSAGSGDFMLCGMVSTRIGHIIIAALIGAWHSQRYFQFQLFQIRRLPHGKASH